MLSKCYKELFSKHYLEKQVVIAIYISQKNISSWHMTNMAYDHKYDHNNYYEHNNRHNYNNINFSVLGSPAEQSFLPMNNNNYNYDDILTYT